MHWYIWSWLWLIHIIFPNVSTELWPLIDFRVVFMLSVLWNNWWIWSHLVVTLIFLCQNMCNNKNKHSGGVSCSACNAFIDFLQLFQDYFTNFKLSKCVSLGECALRNHRYMWATLWENLFQRYANNKGTDQPAHLRSLISTFVIRCLDSIMHTLAKSKMSIIWSQTPKTGFLMALLMYIYLPKELTLKR